MDEHSLDNIRDLELEVNLDDIEDVSDNNGVDVFSAVRDSSFEGTATRAGIQMHDLQKAMDDYARAMNQSAISKAGVPVRTPTPQYKGFAAEEYFKNTLKINALAKGKASWRIGVYTSGEMPKKEILLKNDKETDLSVWTRRHFWSRPERTVDYQSKIHTKASAYAKDFNNPQYKNVKHVGASGYGVPDTVDVQIGRDTISSDTITPDQAAKLADDMKAQRTPDYNKRQEKLDELGKINMGRAIAYGAATGFILSTVSEIIDCIKNKENLSEDQFIESIQHILCGTIESGVRGGAIAGSVQLFGKILGKELAQNSLGAVPIAAAANTAVDLAKDLYRCFVKQSIDTDDLLCNTIDHAFSSSAGFAGGWAGSRAAAGLFASMTSAAETGASIGSVIGPIGTVIGAVVGGLLIGLGAKAVIDTADKDALDRLNQSIERINTQIEEEGTQKAYYFADALSSLDEFRLSFKCLLPCYNLISDLKEYNLRKKKLYEIRVQLRAGVERLDAEKKKGLQELEKKQNKRIRELQSSFDEQRKVLHDNYRESFNTYVVNSYTQYIGIYDILTLQAEDLLQELNLNITEHSYILDYMRHRNEVNQGLNETLSELLRDKDAEALLAPFIDKLMWFMQQDDLLIGRQYISYEEAICLVSGEIAG